MSVLQEAIEALRALEMTGEDPRNEHQMYDVTPEQAGALLVYVDEIEALRQLKARAMQREAPHCPSCSCGPDILGAARAAGAGE